MPVVIEKEIAQREKEISAAGWKRIKIKNRVSRRRNGRQKMRIYKIKIENLEAQAKKTRRLKIVLLKKEQETASRKAQDWRLRSSKAPQFKTERPKPDPVARSGF